MSNIPAILSSAFKVGFRFRCFMSFDLAELEAGETPVMRLRWWPKIPKRMTPRELADFRRGRNALVAEQARIINTDPQEGAGRHETGLEVAPESDHELRARAVMAALRTPPLASPTRLG